MMKTTVKKAEIKDLATLNKISVRSKMYWNYPPAWMEKWIDGLMLKEQDLKEQEIYKLEVSNVIIGYCAMQELEEEYEVNHLWVLPNHIGKGYGRYLLEETMKKVVKKEKPIIVEADPNAESFYFKQGFITFDQKESYPKGRFLPLMKKIKK